jgi:hypothetical protein
MRNVNAVGAIFSVAYGDEWVLAVSRPLAFSFHPHAVCTATRRAVGATPSNCFISAP